MESRVVTPPPIVWTVSRLRSEVTGSQPSRASVLRSLANCEARCSSVSRSPGL